MQTLCKRECFAVADFFSFIFVHLTSVQHTDGYFKIAICSATYARARKIKKENKNELKWRYVKILSICVRASFSHVEIRKKRTEKNTKRNDIKSSTSSSSLENKSISSFFNCRSFSFCIICFCLNTNAMRLDVVMTIYDFSFSFSCSFSHAPFPRCSSAASIHHAK